MPCTLPSARPSLTPVCRVSRPSAGRALLAALGLIAIVAGGGCATSAELEASRNLVHQLESELDEQRQQNAEQRQSIADLSERQDAIAAALAELGRPTQPAKSPAPELARTRETVLRQPVDDAPAPRVDRDGRLVLGRQEYLWLDILQRSVPASLDTGHRTSLIYANKLQRFERDGREWVAFGLAGGEAGRRYESAVARNLKLKLTEETQAVRRPVVRLTMRLGNLVEPVDFVIIEQDNAVPAVVLGRAFLRDLAVIDPALQFTLPKPHPSDS